MQGSNSLNLPEKFTGTITGMFGEKGKEWLGELPDIIKKIAREWSLRVAEPFINLSYHYVAPCICADGTEGVLKAGFPYERSEFFNEVKMLQLYEGRGVVHLLRYSENHFAMLLEKLVPGKTLGELCLKDDNEAVKIAADILQKIVRKAPPGNEGFHRLDDWIGGFQKAENTGFPQQGIEKARKFYRELTDGKQEFLLHGDFHYENILSAGREPFIVIDPKGLIGWVGYDAAVFLNNHRNWLENSPGLQQKLDHAVRHFGEAFGIEPEEVRKWAFIQMVLSAWWTFEENDKRWKSELSKAEIWQV